MVLLVKNSPASTGDLGDVDLIPGLGRSSGGWHGNPLQYSCLENPIDRGAWWAGPWSQRVRHDWSNLACMHAYFTLTTENLVSKLRSAVTIKYASDFENLVWRYECKTLQFIYVILCWNNILDILVQIRCIIKINFNCFLLLFKMCLIEIIKLHKWLLLYFH